MKKLLIIILLYLLSSCTNWINDKCWSGTQWKDSCHIGLECKYDNGCINWKWDIFVDNDWYWSWVCVKKAEYPLCSDKITQ